MEKAKIVVLGLGNFGRSWAEHIVPMCQEAELIGVVDARAETHRGFSVPCYTDLAEALDALRPDLVVNATAPDAHLPTTLMMMARGIPVLCEKPIALSPIDAQIMAAEAKAHGAFLMIGENYRYMPLFRQAKAIFADGHLGKIHQADCRFRHDHPDCNHTYHGKLKHPLLMDVTIHHLDLARYLTGEEPLRITCEESAAPYSWYGERKATADITTDMTGGVRFRYTGTLAAPVSETDWGADWSIECENGMLQIIGRDVYEITAEGRKHLLHNNDPESVSRAAMLSEAIGALRDHRAGETDILDNKRTYDWLQSCIASAEGGVTVNAAFPDEAPKPLIRNFLEAELIPVDIHEGVGLCPNTTVLPGSDFQTPIRFVNYTHIPPACSFGLHRHGRDNELYILLEGEGVYTQNGVDTPVKAGDIMVNAPYGEHGIRNTGKTDMRLLVLEVYC